MFYPKNFGGNLRSWEYLPAVAGTYRAGQLLNVAGGLLVAVDAASTVTPPYLCQCDRVVEEGEPIPVVRVSYDDIYESCLGADAEGLAIGQLLQISAGGETVDAAAEGSFEVVSFGGTAAGDTVCGWFRAAAPGASGTPGAGGSQIATDEEVKDAIDDTFTEGE